LIAVEPTIGDAENAEKTENTFTPILDNIDENNDDDVFEEVRHLICRFYNNQNVP